MKNNLFKNNRFLAPSVHFDTFLLVSTTEEDMLSPDKRVVKWEGLFQATLVPEVKVLFIFSYSLADPHSLKARMDMELWLNHQ